MERFIKQHVPQDERDVIVSEMGLDPDWSVAYTANSGQQDCIIRVQLNDKRRFSAQEYAETLRRELAKEKRFADLRFSFDTGGMVSTALNQGASSPIDIQIEGGRAAPAADLARRIRNRLAGVKGAADVRVLQRLDAPYKVINVQRKKAADMGLRADDVLLQVVAAMNSSVSINRNFWIDTSSNNQYFVAVQYPEDPDRTLDDVLNVPATSNNQDTGVTLRSLVEIKDDTGAVEVNHDSLYRTFDILVNTEGRDIGGVAADVQQRLLGLEVSDWYYVNNRVLSALRDENVSEGVLTQLGTLRDKSFDDREAFLDEVGKVLDAKQRERYQDTILAHAKVARGPIVRGKENGVFDVPGNIHLHMKGEYEQMNRSFGDLILGLALAALLVYLLQVALFRSWVGPFIIMLTVPLGLIGVLTMLFVTRTTLNVQSAMGVIFLVGIAVNNGVLLMDFANKQRNWGAGLQGDHDGSGHPRSADPDDLPGDVPRSDSDGVPQYLRHARRRVEHSAGPCGGGRFAHVHLPDAVRGADHVHPVDEGPAAAGIGPGQGIGRSAGEAGDSARCQRQRRGRPGAGRRLVAACGLATLATPQAATGQ